MSRCESRAEGDKTGEDVQVRVKRKVRKRVKVSRFERRAEGEKTDEGVQMRVREKVNMRKQQMKVYR